MRFSSLEELAARWTLAHTVAVAAWVVAVALGSILLFRNTDTYPSTDAHRVYAGENATFTYPANWELGSCVPGKPFIELPGYIEADYKDQKGYRLLVYGTGAYNCIKDRPERFDIYPENMPAGDAPCAPASSTKGERLGNGLYLQTHEADGEVVATYIKQNSCYAPVDTVVLGFAFTDPNAQPGEIEEFGSPRVNKDKFLASPQYQDIKALAESIRY
ncbi:MAG TPA: hypothetical protein VIS56_02760 [Candidatus Saccharimonadales bacterium]